MAYTPTYQGANTNRGPSPNIWGDCPWIDIQNDPNLGYCMWDDFLSYSSTVSSNLGTGSGSSCGGYRTYETNSCSIKMLNTVTGGAIGLLTAGSDNDVVGIEAGGGNGGAYILTAGTGPKLWFETRFRLPTLDDGTTGKDLFVGLATKGMTAAATTLFSDTAGTMATTAIDLVGFGMLNSATALKTTLQKNGAAQRTVVAAATLVAATFVKVGFIYDAKGVKNSSDVLTWYVNGVKVDSITDDTIATFPTALYLTPTCIFKLQGSDAGAGLDMDWWRCAQLSSTY